MKKIIAFVLSLACAQNFVFADIDKNISTENAPVAHENDKSKGTGTSKKILVRTAVVFAALTTVALAMRIYNEFQRKNREISRGRVRVFELERDLTSRRREVRQLQDQLHEAQSNQRVGRLDQQREAEINAEVNRLLEQVNAGHRSEDDVAQEINQLLAQVGQRSQAPAPGSEQERQENLVRLQRFLQLLRQQEEEKKVDRIWRKTNLFFWLEQEAKNRQVSGDQRPAEIDGAPLKSVADIKPRAGYRDDTAVRAGNCVACADRASDVINISGHDYCRDCLKSHILAAGMSNVDRVDFAGGHTLTRDEIARIVQGNEKILNAFDIAQFDHQNHQDSVELGVKEVTRPCPRCGVAVSKGSMCPHTTCTCGHQFCWHCLNPKTASRHSEPDCRNNIYGAHDDHDDRNDNRD